jgi:ABC-type multidrug transport system ATPase subunit
VVIIHEGLIVANGTPAALGEQYRNRTTFDVSATGSLNALHHALNRIPGVQAITPRSEANGVAAARFESTRPVAEVGPEVAAELSADGLRVVSLVPLRTSLEDVFRALTGRKERI